MKKSIHWILLVVVLPLAAFYAPPAREFYEIRIYHVKTSAQEKQIENYLEKALLPALHKAGVSKIGVLKPIEQDTSDLRVYMIIPYKNLGDMASIEEKIARDASYVAAGKDYIDLPHNTPPFTRFESIILRAFSHNPVLQMPALKNPRDERVYELRSYESHTEKIFKNKVHMFNEGGEVALFKRLGFNAVFYGEVIAGSRMPNLMYMTTFENKASRDEHWKAFGADPEWKKLSSMPEYQNNVSKIDIFFLRPTAYSDF
jgi:hypothetical protein